MSQGVVPSLRIARKPLPANSPLLQYDGAQPTACENDRHTGTSTVNYKQRHSAHPTEPTVTTKVPSVRIFGPRGEKQNLDRDTFEEWSTRETGGSLTWIHPYILFLFGMVFILLSATLGVTVWLSQRYNGFDVSTDGYVWKFGPTALFTILVAFWRQVDRNMRVGQPWLVLSRADSPTQSAMLLDYTSPLLPVALWTSLKNRHWRVTSAMGVFMLLKIIVALSTAIFVLRDVSFNTMESNIRLQDAGSTPSIKNGSNYYLTEVYGNLANNLDFRKGVSANASFQYLSARNDIPVDANVTAEVMAAFTELDCEPAKMACDILFYRNSTQMSTSSVSLLPDDTMLMTLDITSKHCSMANSLSTTLTASCFQNPTSCRSKTSYFSIGESLFCKSWDRSGLEYEKNAFVFGLMAYSVPSTAKEPVVSWTTAAFCQPRYWIERVNLTINARNISTNRGAMLAPPKATTGSQYPGYSKFNLSNDVGSLLTFAPYAKGIVNFPSANESFNNVDGWFQLMLADMKTTKIEELRDYSSLTASAKRVFQRFAAYVTATQFSFPTHQRTQGSITSKKTKLFVLESSSVATGVLLFIAAVVALVLALASLRSLHVSAPAFLSQLPVVVPHASDAITLIKPHRNALEANLIDRSYRTESLLSLDGYGRQLETAVSLNPGANSFNAGHNISTIHSQYWIPMSGKKWFIALSTCIPLVLIAILEILQRMSDGFNGIWEASNTSRVNQSLASLIPAIVMLSTAALFSAAEWAINVFAPFSIAKKRPVLLKQVDQNTSERMAPLAILQAILKGQYAVSLITASALLGSVLTIVASGLYSLSETDKAIAASAYTTSQFDTSAFYKVNTRAANLFQLVNFHNASFPAGTFQDMAFPLIQPDRSAPNIARVLNSASSIDLGIPILRAHLQCSGVPKEHFSYMVRKGGGYRDDYGIGPQVELNVTMDLPKHCQFSSGMFQNTSQLHINSRMWYYGDGAIGASLSYVEGVDAILDRDIGGWSYTWPPYCPSLAIIAGIFSNDTSTDNKTVLLCTQVQQEIPARIRFNLPDLSVNSSGVLQLDEAKAKNVSGYQYNFLDIFGFGIDFVSASKQSDAMSDTFFQSVIQLTNTTIESMVGRSNENLLHNRSNNIYRGQMVHIFGDGMRVRNDSAIKVASSVETLPMQTRLDGQVIDRTGQRLHQNNRSRIILEAILATMTVLAAAAYSMTNFSRTLKYNPCSIAGAAVLLSGSLLAEECVSIATLCHDDQEPRRRLEDREVKLGWWDDEDGNPPRYGLEFMPGDD